MLQKSYFHIMPAFEKVFNSGSNGFTSDQPGAWTQDSSYVIAQEKVDSNIAPLSRAL